MIRRTAGMLAIAWALGFMWFALALPQPADAERTDAIVVPTGGNGRIQRGLEVLRAGEAEKMLVTGVDLDVRPGEFAAEFSVEQELLDCCITLGFSALDTRGNARETAEWMTENSYSSMRLVTSDWHMRRTAVELSDRLPDGVEVLRDAVPTQPSLGTLFVEYHKLIAAWLLHLG
ncbi:YdcF family protein [Alteraurantiacibacter aquimixticola]|uniref:YdcF family protein n=1 Tax=Alteraurantiacibacter aquimixticola TaxID=2489173 RepID=A0A4T3EY73_9SPHN|nr:YdcF family protein [Alteraurantiacibacter aquimixticola]TIX49471.1 YdcF family protein [Alteraurantiacibacter aquimixticola]